MGLVGVKWEGVRVCVFRRARLWVLVGLGAK